MDTLGKLGFVYDVEHNAPDGEVVERQHFHNLMPNEAITWALSKFFIRNSTVPDWVPNNGDNKYSTYNFLGLSFFKNLFTPSKIFDTMKNFVTVAGEVSTEDVYLQSYAPAERISIAGYSRDWVTYYGDLDVSTNTLSFAKVTSGRFYKPTLLTGLFIVASQGITSQNVVSNGLLISEAFFPNPIQMETNGTISVTCGCTLISS